MTHLLVKLQTLGIPSSFCRMYATLLNNSKSVIRSGSTLSAPFSSDKGVPQGDPSSPLLFNLFVSDLPDSLAHTPPSLNNTEIPYIQYADDLVLLADSPDDLQIAIDSLNLYCQENHLKINSEKTKCLIFHKGRLPKLSFLLQNSELEIVSEFKYLGFTFTPQLSFSKHISTITKKSSFTYWLSLLCPTSQASPSFLGSQSLWLLHPSSLSVWPTPLVRKLLQGFY